MFQKKSISSIHFFWCLRNDGACWAPLFVPREAEPSPSTEARRAQRAELRPWLSELHRLCCSPRQITPEYTPFETKSARISVIPGGFAPLWLHRCPAVCVSCPEVQMRPCFSGLETFCMADGTLYDWGKYCALAALLTEQGLNTYL